MKKKLTTKQVVATGIGAAVFLVLFKFVAIPTGIPNTQVNVAQSWLSLLALIFGPAVGFLTAFIGHSLNDAISYGSVWWSWVLADGLYGFILAAGLRPFHLLRGRLTAVKVIVFNLGQMIANALAWGLVAPSLDIFFYREPALKVFLQGGVSTVINVLSTALIGTTLLYLFTRNNLAEASLKKED